MRSTEPHDQGYRIDPFGHEPPGVDKVVDAGQLVDKLSFLLQHMFGIAARRLVAAHTTRRESCNLQRVVYKIKKRLVHQVMPLLAGAVNAVVSAGVVSERFAPRALAEELPPVRKKRAACVYGHDVHPRAFQMVVDG